MNLYLRLAWRNVWRHRRRTVIVIIAIGFTMAMMMMYDGTMEGFQQGIAKNAIKVMGGNIQVHAIGYQAAEEEFPLLPVPDDQTVIDAALQQRQTVAASRRINVVGMTTNREGAFPVNIVGVEPDQEMIFSLVAQRVAEGRYLSADDQDMIYIGKGLADAMQVSIGDRITLVGSGKHAQDRSRTMTVVGIFDVGMPEIEKVTVYVSLAEAQSLYGMTGQSSEVLISLKELGQEGNVIKALQKVLPNYEIVSWETTYPELIDIVGAKNKVMDIFSVIILGIAGIGILNMLLMAVYERTREIGVLAALGLRPRQISQIFLLEGSMIGMVGLAAGVILGLGLNFVFSKVGFDYSSFTSMTEFMALITDRIYPTLGLSKLVQRTITVFIISILAAFIPAREAAQNEPAESLHYV
ncbi:MAG: ABC transporter permease [Anaerolineaceae bacterium]|nr:ABC transporter permease [Anaerolineaceae bacterium]